MGAPPFPRPEGPHRTLQGCSTVSNLVQELHSTRALVAVAGLFSCFGLLRAGVWDEKKQWHISQV